MPLFGIIEVNELREGFHSMQRLRVGVIFGGRSVEHEVSLVSATSVINALNKEKYEIVPIGITPTGYWLSGPNSLQILKDRTVPETQPESIILPDPSIKGLVVLQHSSPHVIPLDVVFPVVHGTFAEDGTLQGLLELANIPYVGAGVLGSAIGMDKIIQKSLLQQAGIPVTPFLWFYASEYNSTPSRIITRAERTLRYPMFVKPARSGSSVGISKSHNRTELREHIEYALQFDDKVLIEKAVPYAREIECSVLGNENPQASELGEIIPSNEFYDYDAKYVDGKSKTEIPAKLPKTLRKKLQAIALQTFRTLDCYGMARVDFLVNRKTNAFVVNEINTIPGFTAISMYPKLWEASGLSYSALLDRLIELALERHAKKAQLKTTYQPKLDWYKNDV